jgi:hypothetical protein
MLPFGVECIQTDNGAEVQASFHSHVLDRGIGHVYIKRKTPRLNGKLERSHRIDAEEFYRLLDGVVIDDTKLFNQKLQEWEDYNFDRPHGGLDGQTPYERLRQKTTTPQRKHPPSVAHGQAVSRRSHRRSWARSRTGSPRYRGMCRRRACPKWFRQRALSARAQRGGRAWVSTPPSPFKEDYTCP